MFSITFWKAMTIYANKLKVMYGYIVRYSYELNHIKFWLQIYANSLSSLLTYFSELPLAASNVELFWAYGCLAELTFLDENTRHTKFSKKNVCAFIINIMYFWALYIFKLCKFNNESLIGQLSIINDWYSIKQTKYTGFMDA